MCNPAAASARTADSRPEPGPFTFTSTLFIPYWSRATPAAASEACCAAYGVPLREPLKPMAPAEDQHITRPSVSVMVICVLLNDAAIGLNFNQPANVHLDLLAEIAFHAAFLLDGLANVVDFLFGQVANLFRVIHSGFRGELLRALPPDAVDRGQPNPQPFLNRKINACYACHETCLLRIPSRNPAYP